MAEDDVGAPRDLDLPGPSGRLGAGLLLALLASSASGGQRADEAVLVADLRSILAGAPAGDPLGLVYLLDCAELLVEQGYVPAAQRRLELELGRDFARMRVELARAGATGDVLAWLDWESALLLDHHGLRDEALATLREASESYDVGNPYLPWILVDRASREREAGATREALQLLERCARVVADAASPAPVAGDARLLDAARREELAAVYVELGMPDLARPLLADARRLAEEIGDPLQWAGCLLRQANLAHALDDFDAQLELVRRFERHPLADEVPADVRAQLRLRFALAEVELEHRGLATEGTAERSLCALLEEGSLSAPERHVAEEARVRSLLDRGELEAARAALERLWAAAGPDASAVELSAAEVDLVALRARLAADDPDGSLDPASELANLERAFDELLRRWRRTPLREGGLGLLTYASSTRVLGERMRLAVLVRGPEDGARRALETLLATQALGSLARSAGLATPGVDEVQEELFEPGAGALVYLADRARSHLVAVDRDEVRYVELAPRFRLDGARKALERQLGPGLAVELDVAAFDAAVERLSALLLPPGIADLLEHWSALRIVGLDSLGYVPFECLRAPDGTRLGTSKALSYLPSLPVGLWLARREARVSPYELELCLVAAPDLAGRPHPRWPELDLPRFAHEEAAALSHAYAPERTVRYLGHAASPALFSGEARSGAGAATVLEVVAHGVFDPRRERPAGLLLCSRDPRGGVLWCEDVERWSAPPLVVLTACGAGRAPLRRGDDGRGHLGGAFLRAGAQAVVLSTTDVPYAAGLALAADFHAQLRSGAGPAEALRRARVRAAVRGDGRSLAPSLVHVLGLGDAPRFPGPAAEPSAPGSRAGILVAVGLLLAAALLWIRRVARQRG